MSVENGKVCCNCRHNIREHNGPYTYCRCEVKDAYIGYIDVMSYWCRHWSKEKEEGDDIK